jgi:hypothetical protein
MTTKRRRGRPRGKCGKVLFFSKLDAEITLARLVWRDKGQARVHYCNICFGDVYHITSQGEEPDRKSRETGANDPQSIDAESSRAIA